MTAGAEHVDMHIIYINRNVSECLNCICVEQNAMLLCYFSDFLKWLDRSNLVVCRHH